MVASSIRAGTKASKKLFELATEKISKILTAGSNRPLKSESGLRGSLPIIIREFTCDAHSTIIFALYYKQYDVALLVDDTNVNQTAKVCRTMQKLGAPEQKLNYDYILPRQSRVLNLERVDGHHIAHSDSGFK